MSFETCPYDSSHVVKPSRLHYHLVKCQKAHPHKKMAICPFNATHHVLEAKEHEHIATCPDRVDMELQRNRFLEPSAFQHGWLQVPRVFGSSLIKFPEDPYFARQQDDKDSMSKTMSLADLGKSDLLSRSDSTRLTRKTRTETWTKKQLCQVPRSRPNSPHNRCRPRSPYSQTSSIQAPDDGDDEAEDDNEAFLSALSNVVRPKTSSVCHDVGVADMSACSLSEITEKTGNNYRLNITGSVTTAGDLDTLESVNLKQPIREKPLAAGRGRGRRPLQRKPTAPLRRPGAMDKND